MNLDIRKNIISNLKGENNYGILESINSAISSQDELVLPGLGVLLELIWNDLSKSEQSHIADLIIKKMN